MKKKKKVTFLIRFAKNILKALRIRNVRLYGSKFSKKVYTLHQHIVLLSLREFHKGIGYRLLCDILPDYSLLLEFLGLARIPHFTTLHKVSQRLRGSTVESIFLGFARRARFRAGIDSTGLSLQHSTYYYEQRLEHFRKAKNRKPGRPRTIMTDHGSQYWAPRPESKQEDTQFRTVLDALGIKHWLARVNRPQTNGKVERFFLTYKTEFATGSFSNIADFIKHYNEARPHMSVKTKRAAI